MSCLLLRSLSRATPATSSTNLVVSSVAISFQSRSYSSASLVRADRRLTVKALVPQGPAKVLEWFGENGDLDLAGLLETLRALGKGSSYIEPNSSGSTLVVEDSRFNILLQKVQAKTSGPSGSIDARALTMVVDALAKFRHRTPGLDELTLSLAEQAKQKPNAFSPKLLSQISLGFSARQLNDAELIEFVRKEALKVVPDVEPAHAVALLEAFRRWGVFDRELVDMLVERMTDEVDRFSSRDIVDCLKVLSDLGLARGFLLRRLAQLAFENLHVFSLKQLTGVLYSLSKLRFLVSANAEDVLDHVREDIEQDNVSIACLSRLAFSLSLLQPEFEDKRLISLLVGRFVQHHRSQTCYLVHLIDACWSVCKWKEVFENHPEYSGLCSDIFKRLYSLPVTKNRVMLAKVHEINNSVENEQWKNLKGVSVEKTWKAVCEEADQIGQTKTESSRLHAEILLKVEQTLKMRKYARANIRLHLQQNAFCAAGFRGDLSDFENKILIDLDAPNRPVTRFVKHRILTAQNWKCASINYWRWRQCRSDEEQKGLCETVLDALLKEKMEETMG